MNDHNAEDSGESDAKNEDLAGSTTRRGEEGTEDWTRDMHSFTTTEYGSIRLRSELLNVTLENDDTQLGFEITRDGAFLGFSAGIADPEDEGPTVRTFHSLTLEEARGFHEALGDAIEEAEKARNEAPGEEDHQSMLEKLMRAI